MFLTEPSDLLTTTKLHNVMIEFTTDCNLKCKYCAVSQPTWKPKYLTIDIEQLIPQLKVLNTDIVVMHGHGETTMINGWHIYADKIKAHGIDTTICTNLMKNYTDEELRALAEMNGITISIDTIDEKQFKDLRRGGNIKQLIYNMTRIQSLAKSINNSIHIVWSCVLTDQTIWNALELVKYGTSLGVKTFCLCNLSTIPDTNVYHLSTLPKQEASKALSILEDIIEYGANHDVYIDVKAGLIDTLRKAVYV